MHLGSMNKLNWMTLCVTRVCNFISFKVYCRNIGIWALSRKSKWHFSIVLQQAFRSEETEKSEIRCRSILAQMLPEAMVAYLENHGPDKFAQIFLGEYDTPEAIWNSQMRQFMIQKIAYHLADFTPRLKSNVKALYQVISLAVFLWKCLTQGI